MLKQTEKMYGWWKHAKIKLKGEQDKNGVDRSENKELRKWRMAAVDQFFIQAQLLKTQARGR